ncbi:MAG TPA: hypothetical protein VK436_04285 [Methanocella sp.]|nr:hypothetical protein [Methanocella sp.]
MKINDPVTLLRASFWIGAILDAFVAIELISPNFWAYFNAFTTHLNSPELNAALWEGAGLMIGWTALLLWADRKPLERKDILLITLFPIVGSSLNNILGILSGLMTLQGVTISLVCQAALTSLYIYSYLNAKNAITQIHNRRIDPSTEHTRT